MCLISAKRIDTKILEPQKGNCKINNNNSKLKQITNLYIKNKMLKTICIYGYVSHLISCWNLINER